MSITVKLRRGSTTQHSTFTGEEAEVTVDTTKDVVVVHDGVTVGGHPMVKASSLAAVATSGDYNDLTNKPTAGTGTVTSVGLSLPSIFSVSGSPVTVSGTLTGTLTNQTANQVFASPNGTSGTPTFRSLVASDIPTLNQNTTGTAANVTGTVAIANGGTGSTTAAGALTALGAYPATNPNGYTNNTGTVTSVALSAPTGFTVSGSPVTSSGTLGLSFDTGYALPTTTKQGQWDTAYNDKINSASFNTADGILTLSQQDGGSVTVDLDGRYLQSYSETDPIYTASSWYTTTNNSNNWNTAFSWGNHASAGYLTSSAIGTTVQAYDADLTAWAGVSTTAKQDTLVSGTNIKTVNGTSLLGSGDITVGSSLTVKDEGTTLTTNVTSFDFVGAGVTASNSGGAVTVTISGGGGGGGGNPSPKALLDTWMIGAF